MISTTKTGNFSVSTLDKRCAFSVHTRGACVTTQIDCFPVDVWKFSKLGELPTQNVRGPGTTAGKASNVYIIIFLVQSPSNIRRLVANISLHDLCDRYADGKLLELFRRESPMKKAFGMGII